MTVIHTYEYHQGEDQQHLFTGTAPTKRADGTPLAPSEIDHYNRYVLFVDAAGSRHEVEQIPVQLTNGVFSEAVLVDALALGEYTYWYRTVDTAGRESVDSDSLVIKVLAPLAAPNPPTGLA
jgi:hypothetical protein